MPGQMKMEVSMKKEEFSCWMESRLKKNSARDCVSRCMRVEKSLEVDLDNEYKKDGGAALLYMLSTKNVSKEDLNEVSKKFGFKEGSNTKYRLSDMKSAVNRYFKYLQQQK